MDQLQGAVEQLQEDGCNAMTGSFHNPAHNCSHIVYNNPNATSGMYVCMYITKFVVVFFTTILHENDHRLLLVTE